VRAEHAAVDVAASSDHDDREIREQLGQAAVIGEDATAGKSLGWEHRRIGRHYLTDSPRAPRAGAQRRRCETSFLVQPGEGSEARRAGFLGERFVG